LSAHGTVDRPLFAGSRLFVVWGLAAFLVAAASVAVAVNPLLLLGVAGAAVACGLLLLAFTSTRWFLVVSLALVVGYVPNVLSQQLGVVLSLQTLIIIVGLGVAARRLFNIDSFRLPAESLWILALFGAYAVSLVLAQDRPRGVAVLVELVDITILVLLMLAVLDTPEWLRRAVWAFALPASLLAGLAILQQATGAVEQDYLGFAKVEEERDLFRSAGPLSPVYFGQMLVAGAMLSLYLGLSAVRRVERIAAGALFVLALGGILFSFSRGAWVAIVIALGIAAFLRKTNVLLPVVITAGAIVLGALVLPADAKTRVMQFVNPGETGLAYSRDESVSNRFAENLAAVHMFRDYPLTGVGPGNYPTRYNQYAGKIGIDARAEERTGVLQQPHSLYLQSLAETGFLGSLVFFTLLGLALGGCFRARQRLPGREGVLAEGVFVALAGFLVGSVFLHAAYPQYLWIVIGLGLVTRRLGLDALRLRSPA
jgi:putative inorganic carbon (HCO3(-)) transporter